MSISPLSSLSSSFVVFTFLCFCCFLQKNFATTEFAVAGRRSVHVASFVPATTCSPSTLKVTGGKSSVKVVHRHGPCAKLSTDGDKATVSELLSQDESRVRSIQSRAALNSGRTFQETDSVTIPAKSGSSLGTGNYIVTIGLGTPKRDLSLVFDTGSDLTWTQCQPCARSCYSQQEPIFDPSVSKSYKNVSCTSSQCSALISATGNTPSCAASTNTCIYGIQYGDQSFSVGYLAEETVTLLYSEVFPNLLFGCGQNNQGLFRGAAGLLGLGRDPLSFISQTAGKYGKYFSYCLPTPSGAGHLSFGKGKTMNIAKAKFTPLKINSQLPSFYFIDIIGIKVGMKVLPISKTIFTTSGTVIDSGTVITRLPPSAYSVMKTEFRKQMSNYNLTNSLSILDTCYDLSSYKSVSIPKCSFIFGGNVELALQSYAILYATSTSQVCLAFAPNGDDSQVAIFGNVQQQSLEVIYDVDGGKLGFAGGACS